MPDGLRVPSGTAPARPAHRSFTQAGLVAAGLIALLWLQEVADQLVFGSRLDRFGIVPRTLDTLGNVFTAPFLHAGLGHLIANTLPLALLAFLNALRGAGRFAAATLLIVVIGGALVWLLARPGNHLGASELVFGYFGLLLSSAWHDRRPGDVLAAVAALVLYGGALWGVLPGNPYISWESHLFGFMAGVIAARLLRTERNR